MVTRRQFLKSTALTAASAGVLGACTSDDQGDGNDDQGSGDQGGGDAPEQAYQFSYLRPIWGPATFTPSGPFQQHFQDQAGVDIDIQIVPVADYDTSVTGTVASGDLPDVIWGTGPVTSTWRDIERQGAFLPINDYLDQFPAVRDAVPDTMWDIVRSDDGAIYFIPNLIWPEVPFFTYYRQDLFDQAGLEEPTTVEGFVEVLREAKQAFPDMVPLTMPDEWYSKELGAGMGVAKFGWEPSPDDPNTLLPWYAKESEIDLYLWLQDLHREELLDPEFKVADPNAAFDKFKAGQSMCVVAHWNEYMNFLGELRQIEPDAEMGIMSPIGEGGNRQVFPGDRGFYVSAEASDPERFFEFLQWTLTDGNTLRRYGIEGETFEVVDGTNVLIPEDERSTDYQRPQLEPLEFLGPFDEKLDWAQTQLNYEAGGYGEYFGYVKDKFDEHAASFITDYRNPTVKSETEDDIGAQIDEDYLRPIYESAIIDHDITKSDWLAAVDTWRANGGDQIIAEVNEAQEDKSMPNYAES